MSKTQIKSEDIVANQLLHALSFAREDARHENYLDDPHKVALTANKYKDFLLNKDIK